MNSKQTRPSPVLVPVVHITNRRQALVGIETVLSAGLSRVCLIDHDETRSWGYLCLLAEEVLRDNPGLWLSVNYLDLGPEEALDNAPDGLAALWCDDHIVASGSPKQPLLEGVSSAYRRALVANPKLLLCAAVAFKYQPDQPATAADLQQVTRLTGTHFPVIVTSGPGTGEATDPTKLRLMREALDGIGQALPDPPPLLAVASGVDAQNIGELVAAGADLFFVHTSIASHGLLDPNKLAALQDALARSSLM